MEAKCTMIKVKKIIGKWNNRVNSIEASKMSETEPFFAIAMVKNIIEDLEEILRGDN